MKQTVTLKQLQSQLGTVEGEMAALQTEISHKQKELQTKRKNAAELKQRINNFAKNGAPQVSEHAILRYLERVKGVDIKAIEKEILSAPVLELVDKLGGSGSYPNGNFSVVMKNNTVVTIT
jgi:septal ring factor EnvC (AmiA/AmiB activator)